MISRVSQPEATSTPGSLEKMKQCDKLFSDFARRVYEHQKSRWRFFSGVRVSQRTGFSQCLPFCWTS